MSVRLSIGMKMAALSRGQPCPQHVLTDKAVPSVRLFSKEWLRTHVLPSRGNDKNKT